jgi:hypothetical protein
MSLLPAVTEISDTYPNPNNAVGRLGFFRFWTAVYEFFQKPEIDVPSATTCDIGGQSSTKLRITGSTTITSFGTTYRGPIQLRMFGPLIITHNATTLRCPGAANITTAAGDVLQAWPTSTVSGTADGWQIVLLSRGDGIVPITSGGTGAPSAALAFLGMKQAATSSATGVVELSTDAEAQTHTDTVRAVTPANLGATVLGMGQTWQNMTASRAVSTTYTNSTGRSILLNVAGVLSNLNAQITVLVSGTQVAASSAVNATAVGAVAGVLVPNGATYSVVISAGTLTSILWVELR